MNIVRIFLASVVLVSCGAAMGQYQWIDQNGRKIFSDRPPPAEIPDQNVLKQPRGAGAISPPASANAETPSSVASGEQARVAQGNVPMAPQPAASTPAVDPELEEKKRQAEAAEAAKNAAEERRIAAQRAENCRRARAAKAGFDSGARIARTNDKGEREFLDDAARAAELKRLHTVIQSECS